jgi:hypothetical protein
VLQLFAWRTTTAIPELMSGPALLSNSPRSAKSSSSPIEELNSCPSSCGPDERPYPHLPVCEPSRCTTKPPSRCTPGSNQSPVALLYAPGTDLAGNGHLPGDRSDISGTSSAFMVSLPATIQALK